MGTPSPWGGSGGATKDTCIGCGFSLSRDNLSYKEATPIVFKSNLAAKPEDLKIPHSELAMHVGAADKEILALFTTKTLAFVVFSDGEGCGYTSGSINELLSPNLQGHMKGFPTT